MFQRLYRRWRRIPWEKRRFYKQHFTWISIYLVFCPILLYKMIEEFYEIQTRTAIRTSIPDEVNQANFEEWLKKQQREGKFLDED